MRLGMLSAAALVCAAVGPALAYGGGAAAGGRFTAVDYAWRANDTDATRLTIAPQETVTFGYPAGTDFHNVVFEAKEPSSCTGLPPGPRPKGWQGECRFDDPGTYAFRCGAHPEMTGTVVVDLPPTPTSDSPATTPTATPVPTPGTHTPQADLRVRLPSRQRGTRVKGSVNVKDNGSRLEVTLTAGRTRAGRWLKRAAAAGTVAFSAPLDARARRTLRRRHRLVLTVTVALTPPGGSKLTHRARVTIRSG